MKSPVMRIVGLGTWLVTSLVAINVGLLPFGYDFFSLSFMQSIFAPAHYLALAFGILSLVMFFMALSCTKCRCCGDAPCTPNNYQS